MKTLSNVLSFGGIDADTDQILFDCFEDHEAYEELLNFRKFLIVGRKGSGKTAIFKKMIKTKETDFFLLAILSPIILGIITICKLELVSPTLINILTAGNI